MNVMFVGPDLIEGTAINSIFSSFGSLIEENDEITFAGLGNCKKIIERRTNQIRQIDIPITSNKLTKIIKKASRLFDFEYFFKSFLFLKSMRKLKIAFSSYDAFVAVAGDFFTFETAYRLSKKFNKPLFLIYFDKFSSFSSRNNNVNRRQKKERQWCERATKIFIREGLGFFSNDFNNKISFFKIPIDTKKSIFSKKSKRIIYGGLFYKSIRNPDHLLDLTKRQDLSGYNFEIYSNYKGKNSNNVSFHPILDINDYHAKLKNIFALIIIGNTNVSNYNISKQCEGISLGVPLILIDINKSADEYLRNYPFAFDYRDVNLEKKIKQIDPVDIQKFDIHKYIPETSPRFFYNSIWSKIKRAN